MSQGLGKWFMSDVADKLIRQPGLGFPSSLNHRGKSLPLGRYLRRKLSEMADVEIPPYKDTVLPSVQEYAFRHKKSIQSVYQELFSEPSLALENKIRVAHEAKQAQAFSL